ncbi:hypothetical protein WR25_14733 [Diploscapter pachys]|uniref:Uncharacterized protein n=1 Tax=Diploscapter pachys TaxID=2018661 RepID=A0A2A2J9L9_9BILA|nr:hypothetical protein WR25_14733 [Diploscapter pachys]
MASFFNESDLKKCLKNCDFCRTPEKVSQQANALKTAKERRRGIFWIRERAGENGKRGGCQAKTAVQDEFERRRKVRESANRGDARKARRVTHHCSSSSDSSYNHTGSGRQLLLVRQPADIEYNSCYLQSKTLSSYNHKSYVVFI